MDIKEVSLEARPFIGIRERVSDVGEFFARVLPVLYQAAERYDLEVVGAPLGVYYQAGGSVFDMAVGLAVEEIPESVEAPVFADELASGRAVTAEHVGPYDTLIDSWMLLLESVKVPGQSFRAAGWEEYVLGPESGPDPSQWRTIITQPV